MLSQHIVSQQIILIFDMNGAFLFCLCVQPSVRASNAVYFWHFLMTKLFRCMVYVAAGSWLSAQLRYK